MPWLNSVDTGTKLFVGGVACYIIYNVSRRALTKATVRQHAKRHLKYASKKTTRMHLHLLGGATICASSFFICRAAGLKLSPLFLIPVAGVGIVARMVSYSARTAKAALWSAFFAGAGIVTASLVPAQLSQAPSLVQHSLLFSETVALSAAVAVGLRLVSPANRQGATLLASSIVAPLLLVVPGQLAAIHYAPSYLSESWYPAQLSGSSLPALSMTLGALAFGAHTAATAFFREQHARHFIERARAASAAGPGISQPVLDGNGSGYDSADDSDSESDAAQPAPSVARSRAVRLWDEDGVPQTPRRFHELPYELKRELELLTCPAHEARIEALLSRLERVQARSARRTPPSLAEKEEIVAVVQKENLEWYRHTEHCMPNLEGLLAGDELDESMILFADGIFAFVPSAVSSLLYLWRQSQIRRYQEDRQAGRVRRRQREYNERLSALYNIPNQPPTRTRPGSQLAPQPQKQNFQAGLRWEFDLDDVYAFATAQRWT